MLNSLRILTRVFPFLCEDRTYAWADNLWNKVRRACRRGCRKRHRSATDASVPAVFYGRVCTGSRCRLRWRPPRPVRRPRQRRPCLPPTPSWTPSSGCCSCQGSRSRRSRTVARTGHSSSSGTDALPSRLALPPGLRAAVATAQWCSLFVCEGGRRHSRSSHHGTYPAVYVAHPGKRASRRGPRRRHRYKSTRTAPRSSSYFWCSTRACCTSTEVWARQVASARQPRDRRNAHPTAASDRCARRSALTGARPGDADELQAHGTPWSIRVLQRATPTIVMAVLASLLNVVCAYDPVGYGLPYATLDRVPGAHSAGDGWR